MVLVRDEATGKWSAPAFYRTSGEMTNVGWNFTPGADLFVGLNGLITETAPTVGFSQRIGTARTPTTITIRLSEPITL